MVPTKIRFDDRDCYDIGWGIIRPQCPGRKGPDELFIKPRESEADDWAALYVSNSEGHCSGIYMVTRTDEARRFVQDRRTKGGTWSYFWTSLSNLVQRGGLDEIRFTNDTGKMDEVLEDLDIRTLTKAEIAALFQHLGYAKPDIITTQSGVIWSIDDHLVDIVDERPVDISEQVAEHRRHGRPHRVALCRGWVDLNSNLAVDAVWRDWVTIKYDRKYR